MQLKSQVEWALHCCTILGGLPPERYIPAKALSEFHGVPKEYLSKALQGLSQAGIVETTLGKAGGYRLARPAAAITFLDIVEAVEGQRSTFACSEIRANNPCRPASHRDSGACAIARVMWDADQAWRRSLAAVRLSDLAEMLRAEVPGDILDNSARWLLDRAG